MVAGGPMLKILRIATYIMKHVVALLILTVVSVLNMGQALNPEIKSHALLS